jgi:hypothetical protein
LHKNKIRVSCLYRIYATNEEILGLAQRGNVLIKGWGAATMLCEVPHVISARVCAPMEFRVRVVMERLGRNDKGAVRNVSMTLKHLLS